MTTDLTAEVTFGQTAELAAAEEEEAMMGRARAFAARARFPVADPARAASLVSNSQVVKCWSITHYMLR